MISKRILFVQIQNVLLKTMWTLKREPRGSEILATGLARVQSFFLSGGVREKRVECKRSCVSLVRLFTWRIRRGGSRQEMEGREVNKPAKARLLLWRARSSIVCRRTRFSKCPWRMSLPDKRSRGKKRSSQEGDRYHEPDSVGSSCFFSLHLRESKDAHSNVPLNPRCPRSRCP